jgi:hypothetical protein
MRAGVYLVVFACAFQSATSADENPKVNLAFEKLDAALATEAQRLRNADKADEAARVLAIQKAVEEQITPLNDPGKCAELRTKLFVDQLTAGNWNRAKSTEHVVFGKSQTPRGPVLSISHVRSNGEIVVQGLVRLTGEESAEAKWTHGVVWKIYAAGKQRLLVDEYNGAERINDGIMLFRGQQ